MYLSSKLLGINIVRRTFCGVKNNTEKIDEKLGEKIKNKVKNMNFYDVNECIGGVSGAFIGVYLNEVRIRNTNYYLKRAEEENIIMPKYPTSLRFGSGLFFALGGVIVGLASGVVIIPLYGTLYGFINYFIESDKYDKECENVYNKYKYKNHN